MEWNQGCAAARRAGVLPLQAAAAAMCGSGGPWPCSCEALIPVPVWPTGLWLSLEFLGGRVLLCTSGYICMFEPPVRCLILLKI